MCVYVRSRARARVCAHMHVLFQSLHSEARLAQFESHFSCIASGKLNAHLGFSFFTYKIRVTLLFCSFGEH